MQQGRRSFGREILLATTMLAITTLFGCGGEGDASESSSAPNGASNRTPKGPVAVGDELYHRPMLGPKNSPGCAFCHRENAAAGAANLGPYTEGIATRAETRVPGMSAQDYLRQSILDADAYLVDGYTKGSMTGSWSTDLKPEEVDALVTYLLTRK